MENLFLCLFSSLNLYRIKILGKSWRFFLFFCIFFQFTICINLFKSKTSSTSIQKNPISEKIEKSDHQLPIAQVDKTERFLLPKIPFPEKRGIIVVRRLFDPRNLLLWGKLWKIERLFKTKFLYIDPDCRHDFNVVSKMLFYPGIYVGRNEDAPLIPQAPTYYDPLHPPNKTVTNLPPESYPMQFFNRRTRDAMSGYPTEEEFVRFILPHRYKFDVDELERIEIEKAEYVRRENSRRTKERLKNVSWKQYFRELFISPHNYTDRPREYDLYYHDRKPYPIEFDIDCGPIMTWEERNAMFDRIYDPNLIRVIPPPLNDYEFYALDYSEFDGDQFNQKMQEARKNPRQPRGDLINNRPFRIAHLPDNDP